MKLGLTYDLQTDPGDPRQAEFDSPQTIEALAAALTALGHEGARLGNADALLRDLERARRVDLVWNLAEGSRGRCREAWVPAVLEQFGVPFVGSGSRTLMLALDKAFSKQLARSCGVATPAWAVISRVEDVDGARVPRFPVVVKPRHEGSGMGIDPAAVVNDVAEVRERAAMVLSTWQQPCVVEEFIPFGEVTVFVIGNDPPEALPVVQRPLDPDSRLSCHVARRPEGAGWISPVELSPSLEDAAGRAALTLFNALGCRDMARVDFRVDENHRLYFLEINPLPSLDPEGTIGLLAEVLGVRYEALIGRILDAALHRTMAHEQF